MFRKLCPTSTKVKPYMQEPPKQRSSRKTGDDDFAVPVSH